MLIHFLFFFYFFYKARKCLLVDGSAICISSRDASYLGQSCWGTCSAEGHRPPGATGVYSSDSSSCYRLGESPAILGGQTHFLKKNVVKWGFNSLLTDKTKQIFKSPPPQKKSFYFLLTKILNHWNNLHFEVSNKKQNRIFCTFLYLRSQHPINIYKL